jgi:membrane protein YdbS with pleckstrin-like domain
MAKKEVSRFKKSETFALIFLTAIGILLIASFFRDLAFDIMNNAYFVIIINVFLFLIFIGYAYYRFISD